MTYRIGWLSPLTPASGVGTFSHAVTRAFPDRFEDETIDLTILHVAHRALYDSRHRLIQIDETETFHQVLTLFDLLVYNIGNNREHHESIFNLLRIHPGVIVCHDFVYQHYLADRSIRFGRSFTSYAALLLKYGNDTAPDYLRRSRITSRTGNIRYAPWDSEASVSQPMSEVILDLGSALVVHSGFAETYAKRRFAGPILRLGMPHDQKQAHPEADLVAWQRVVVTKRAFHMVSFGHIQPSKCIDLVLSAIAASKKLRRTLRYTIAGFSGDAHYFAGLETMVQTLALRDVISFETDVSENRLKDLMGEADIFINLRKPNTEGSSASLIEQLDIGKPVVVLDSGCYSEIPDDGAVKLPADASSADVQAALEHLVEAPDAMPPLGRAGRAYARRWTCQRYAEEFLRFARRNREDFAARGRLASLRPASSAPAAAADGTQGDDWAVNLARARAALHYFDGNILAVDPQLLAGKGTAELCDYVAHVLFGIFGNAPLQRALARFFAARRGAAAYWACVRFSLIVEAVFSEQTAACQRLTNLGPCYEPEFWDVVERFPAKQYFATAALVLAGRPASPNEVSTIDEADAYPKRLRVLELLRALKPDAGGGLDRLRAWLEQPASDLNSELPVIDRDFECQVGSEAFRQVAELSGFHTMEQDHVWARGHRGFIGLRLGCGVVRVEALVRHSAASTTRPCVVGLSSGKSSVQVDLADGGSQWISLEVSRHLVEQASTLWFELSTDHAGHPLGVRDPRILGAGLTRIRVVAEDAQASQATVDAGAARSLEEGPAPVGRS